MSISSSRQLSKKIALDEVKEGRKMGKEDLFKAVAVGKIELI